MSVLEVRNLKKKLGKREIIKGIDLSIEEGEVFGFLGPNGAGKTTTIRMLVGLIKSDSGTIKIMGHDIQHDRENALSCVGAVVENPELYTYMTGWQNLLQLKRIYRNITTADMEEVVKLVGLNGRMDDKVKKYSLGMKQRLGLAEALLAKPKLLILDEPTNGLDPSGIIELRNLIKSLAAEKNISVFVSSHILSEMEQMCTKVAFIDGGIIKSVESLNGDTSDESFDSLFIVARDILKCVQTINELPYISKLSHTEDKISLTIEKGRTPDLIFHLAKNNLYIEEVYKRKQQLLEDRYMELVEGGSK